MSEPLDRLETSKDTIQVAIESGATHVGGIIAIVVGAVRDITREVGEWATDVFEMQEAAQRAHEDDVADAAPVPGPPAKKTRSAASAKTRGGNVSLK